MIVKQTHAIIARCPVAMTIGESIISGTIGERRLVMQSCKARQFVKLYPIDVNYILCMKCPVINQGELLPLQYKFLDKIDIKIKV